jgi:hypothetical protein
MVKVLDTRVATAGDRPAVLDTAHLGNNSGHPRCFPPA